MEDDPLRSQSDHPVQFPFCTEGSKTSLCLHRCTRLCCTFCNRGRADDYASNFSWDLMIRASLRLQLVLQLTCRADHQLLAACFRMICLYLLLLLLLSWRQFLFRDLLHGRERCSAGRSWRYTPHQSMKIGFRKRPPADVPCIGLWSQVGAGRLHLSPGSCAENEHFSRRRNHVGKDNSFCKWCKTHDHSMCGHSYTSP